jgi:hypothetical protein
MYYHYLDALRHAYLCWGQLFFSWEDPGICTPTINSTPKATASNAPPSQGFASTCKIFQFQETQSTGQGRRNPTLPSLYPTSTFPPQLLHQPVAASRRFPPHHRQRVEPMPSLFLSPCRHPAYDRELVFRAVCVWPASTCAQVS